VNLNLNGHAQNKRKEPDAYLICC